MRLKLIPSASFDPHDDASAQRDNIAVKKSTTTNSQQIFQMQISKEALQNDDSNDEGLTEEDLKVSLHHLCVQGLKHTMDLFRRRDDESRDQTVLSNNIIYTIYHFDRFGSGYLRA